MPTLTKMHFFIESFDESKHQPLKIVWILSPPKQLQNVHFGIKTLEWKNLKNMKISIVKSLFYFHIEHLKKIQFEILYHL